MKFNYLNKYLKILYIFFIFQSLFIFFFSTGKIQAKSFDIKDIEISRPFEINFDKNNVIDEGFRKAFSELTTLILNSKDQMKIEKIKLNEIKGMVESFSIKEEKFVKEIYYVKLGVSFNKKKVFNFLEKNNIFPSAPNKIKFLFIPIIIDESQKDLLIFNKNIFFNKWNDDQSNKELIEYILPTEDLEDLKEIKNNYNLIEEYDFKKIISKYNLDNSVVALIFKSQKEIRILSRITNNKNISLKNQSFPNFNIDDEQQFNILKSELKLIYEDYWKKLNEINTSIKLIFNIKVKNDNGAKIIDFESVLNDLDLVYDFFITKFDKKFTYYQITFNGTPNIFLQKMNQKGHDFDKENQVWLLK